MLDDRTKRLILELRNRLQSVENEITLLKEDKKDLLAEFKAKLDVKTFQGALKVLKIHDDVSSIEVLDDMVSLLDSDPEDEDND